MKEVHAWIFLLLHLLQTGLLGTVVWGVRSVLSGPDDLPRLEVRELELLDVESENEQR